MDCGEMKWFVLAGFLILARHAEGGALKCSPGIEDTTCRTDPEEKAPPVQISEDEIEKEMVTPEAECLAGSEWDSNCHYCRCSESGIAECLKQDNCDIGIQAEPLQCKPNTTFQRDCNTCVCMENGLALCTLDTCRRSSIPKKSELKPGNDCLPGSSWWSQCNSCGCDGDGYALCTESVCPEPATGPIMRCAPNTIWSKECNTCWCTTDGKAMCTRIGCETITGFNSEITERSATKEITRPKSLEDNLVATHDIIKRSVCKPSQEFQSECNLCKCAPNGQSYSCTHNECLEGDKNDQVEVFMQSEGVDHIERHSVCKPRDTFYVGCNICHCNLYGTDYTCTNKPCPLPADVELFHELRTTKSSIKPKQKVCVANRMFIKDCNTCWCNDDGTSFFCTRRVCVPMSPDEGDGENGESEDKFNTIKKDCRPDEVFEIDCNMCRCNLDGKSFSCTRRACMDQSEDQKNLTLSRKIRSLQEASKTCQPRQEFRLDCNKCLCDNEGQTFSCTRIDCNALNNHNSETRRKREVSEQVIAKCEPGSVFDQGCNVCRCTEDGHHATCALKRCHQENDVDGRVPEQDPSFRCNPGEQFTRDCNDCSCSADGKSIFCTIRLCDLDTAPAI